MTCLPTVGNRPTPYLLRINDQNQPTPPSSPDNEIPYSVCITVHDRTQPIRPKANRRMNAGVDQTSFRARWLSDARQRRCRAMTATLNNASKRRKRSGSEVPAATDLVGWPQEQPLSSMGHRAGCLSSRPRSCWSHIVVVGNCRPDPPRSNSGPNPSARSSDRVDSPGNARVERAYRVGTLAAGRP